VIASSSSRHRCAGCTNRAIHQLDRAKAYLARVTPVIADKDEDPNRQFLYQSMVLMIQSFYEEYLRCIVSIGTFWKAPAVRTHLGNQFNDRARFDAMPAAEVMRHAQDRVSFKEDARPLREIMQVIIGRSPFADERNHQTCLDVVNVRNIIAHAGGWPNESHAPNIKTAGVIVTTEAVAGSKFYQLHINRAFFGEALLGLFQSIQTVEQACAADPELQL
jgi:hypothetical protein